ncbi:MAG: tetratricopeptide repeat protein [Burkholderiaceae bacterium]
MTIDATGLTLSTPTETAAAALRAVQHAYLCYRRDLPQRLGELLQADPAFGFAHTVKALMLLGGFRASDAPVIRAALLQARDGHRAATERERLHWQAAVQWHAGDPLGATRVFEVILARWPHDLLAYRLHHFVSFWLGRPENMLQMAERLQTTWQPEWPFYGSLLACRAFANEEAGNHTLAENLGRRSVELDPGDPWGAHAVAHVLEMQGRREEGIQWVDSLQEHWHDRNNLAHHLWWHQGLYCYELGDFNRVLALYDQRFRNLASPLTAALPDLYIDVQNAVSMLFRLQLQQVDVGDRWTELADLAEQRTGDCESLFTVPHWAMALVATGRDAAVARLIGGIEAYGQADPAAAAIAAGLTPAAAATPGHPAQAMDYVLPLCRAVVHHGRGEYRQACDLIRPIIGDLFKLGGSHAQQDLLEQLYVDAAIRGDQQADQALLLSRAQGRGRLAPSRRRGWAGLAAR